MAAKQPPPLMKKHSQTDLVSRLKTRKILGVGGEDDDGEVHRSKALAVRVCCALLRHCHHGPRLPRPAL
uniref:Tumor protein p53-inducible protein 11 n=1 Tax=Equus asinus TaxID=9793 RepID=A0A8C4M592_EQUAS